MPLEARLRVASLPFAGVRVSNPHYHGIQRLIRAGNILNKVANAGPLARYASRVYIFISHRYLRRPRPRRGATADAPPMQNQRRPVSMYTMPRRYSFEHARLVSLRLASSRLGSSRASVF